VVAQDAEVPSHWSRRLLTDVRSPCTAKLLKLASVSGDRSRAAPGWAPWLSVEGPFDPVVVTPLLLFVVTAVSLSLVGFVPFGSPHWSVELKALPQRSRSGCSAEAPPQLAT
jgi:hypothetical protein